MSDARQKSVVVSKPILYGSVATYLGRKAEETKTHRWSIYLRGVDNEDLSYMISKVVISLPTCELCQPCPRCAYLSTYPSCYGI